jgi:hypothetical protein
MGEGGWTRVGPRFVESPDRVCVAFLFDSGDGEEKLAHLVRIAPTGGVGEQARHESNHAGGEVIGISREMEACSVSRPPPQAPAGSPAAFHLVGCPQL